MEEEIENVIADMQRKRDTVGYCDYVLDSEKAQQLLDCITKLKQENEKLKYNARGQVNDYFKDKYAEEVLKNAELKQEKEDYKLRCKKAINYIKSTNCYGMRSGKTLLQKYLYELLNILNGSGENE